MIYMGELIMIIVINHWLIPQLNTYCPPTMIMQSQFTFFSFTFLQDPAPVQPKKGTESQSEVWQGVCAVSVWTEGL